MKETDRNKIKETDSDSGAIIQTKNSKTIRDFSKSQLKETDRDKIKETDSDSCAIIQTKNSKTNRDYSKTQMKDTDGEKIKETDSYNEPSYRRKMLIQPEKTKR